MAGENRISRLVDAATAAAIVAGGYGDPFAVLGMHGPDIAGGMMIRALSSKRRLRDSRRRADRRDPS